ncbi:hypothetical protein HJFPF1_05451 [Paramyrothecium foliicola]|nr:hypothetical protein HJFPF1_05451 [Paramyrothecium foliicola]
MARAAEADKAEQILRLMGQWDLVEKFEEGVADESNISELECVTPGDNVALPQDGTCNDVAQSEDDALGSQDSDNNVAQHL